MSSSDIYQIKESPWAKKDEKKPKSPRRRRRRIESFDETMNKDISRTNLRRRKNSGFRRFRHLMKKPDYSRKFWTTALSVGAGILIVLLIWDWFFRYPGNPDHLKDPSVYEMKIK